MADEDRTEREQEESAKADAARAESDPSSIVEPGGDLTEDDAADEDFAADLRDDSATDADRVPEPVGATAGAGAKAASGRVSRSSEVAKKDRPTPKRDSDVQTRKRTGPITFVKESVDELRKVVYPTGPQLASYFVVVLVFVLAIIAYVSLLDLGFGAAMFRLFSS